MKKTIYILFCALLLSFLSIESNAQCTVGETEYFVNIDLMAGGAVTYPNEISWAIFDSNGNLIVSTACGDYAGSSGVQPPQSVCLPDAGAPYTLEAYDDWGDGWNGSTIEITDAGGNTVACPQFADNGAVGDQADDCAASQTESVTPFDATTLGCVCGDGVCEGIELYCDCVDCATNCAAETDPVFIGFDTDPVNGGFFGTANTMLDTIAGLEGPIYCNSFVTGGVNDGTKLFLGIGVFGPPCIGGADSLNLWNVSTTQGFISTDGTTPITQMRSAFVHWLCVTQAEIDAAVGAGGSTTITWANPMDAGCTDQLVINWADFGNASTLVSDKCVDCTAYDNSGCTVWSDANNWDSASNILPSLVVEADLDGDGTNDPFIIQADQDTIALYQSLGVSGPLFCQDYYGGTNTGDTITLQIAVFDDEVCLGDAANPYTVTASGGTFFGTGGSSTINLEEASIAFLDLTPGDIGSGTVTITFTDPIGGCTASMVVDFSWFGNTSTLITDLCPLSCDNDGICEGPAEDYCGCVDCTSCSSWSDANNWDASSDILPAVVGLADVDGDGNPDLIPLEPDQDTIALYQNLGVIGPLFCPSIFGGTNSADTIRLVLAALDNVTCVGDATTPYNLSTTSGTLFDLFATTPITSVEEGIAFVLELTSSDIAAGSVTVTFTNSADPGCSADLTLDFNWLGNTASLISDLCICPNNIVVNDPIVPANISSGLYEASNFIEWAGGVIQTDTVTFHAGNYVEIQPEFDVPINTQFTIDINPCGTAPLPKPTGNGEFDIETLKD